MADEVTRLREEVAKLASQFDAFFSAKEEESKAHGVLLRELVISVERNHTEQKEFVSKQLEGLATGLESPDSLIIKASCFSLPDIFSNGFDVVSVSDSYA